MISVFLSSTFQDMQVERNLIQKYVFPEVERYAQRCLQTINLVDLRWGIDTSLMSDQDANEKILFTCTKKIKDSYPYFIALLGKNYGTEINKSSHACSNLTHGRTIGITEYEIVTRLNMGTDNVKFFIRNDVENIPHREQELRQVILMNYQDSTIGYELSTKEQIHKFITKMVQVICGFIDHKVKCSQQRSSYMNFIHTCCESIVSRQKYDVIFSSSCESMPHCILLTGLKGIGKKSILYKYISTHNYMAIGIHAANLSHLISISLVRS